MKNHRICLLALCLVLAVGCSDDHRDLAYPPPFPWQFERIADLDTADEGALAGGYVGTGIAVDARGRVSIVTDAWEGVHRFGRDGQWLDNLGGEGQGPGEFQYVFGIAAHADGDLLLFDNLAQRLTHLNDDGTYLRSLHVAISPMWKAPLGFGDTDKYWVFDRPFGRPVESLLLLSARGDTLVSISVSEPTSLLTASRRLSLPNPAARDLKWTVDDRGIAYALTSSREYLLRAAPTNSTPDTIWTEFPPLTLTSAQWESYVDAQMDSLATNLDYAEHGATLRRLLNEARGDLNPVQQMWWVDDHGILVNRRLEVSNARPVGEGRYAAILADGAFSREAEGPAGIVWAAHGYAVQLKSVWGELPEMTLWRLVPRQEW